MPGKKPAKLATDIKTQKPLLGRRVLYLAPAGAKAAVCENCHRSKRKGMMSYYKEKLYCSEDCIASSI